MNQLQELSKNILNVSSKIFDINEINNPETIFVDKTFYIYGDIVSTQSCCNKDHFYYFEHQDVDGVIVKSETGIYCIKSGVKYINSKGNKWAFAKIRIDNFNNKVNISGRRTRSWEDFDTEDENFEINTDYELPLGLSSMNDSLEYI